MMFGLARQSSLPEGHWHRHFAVVRFLGIRFAKVYVLHSLSLRESRAVRPREGNPVCQQSPSTRSLVLSISLVLVLVFLAGCGSRDEPSPQRQTQQSAAPQRSSSDPANTEPSASSTAPVEVEPPQPKDRDREIDIVEQLMERGDLEDASSRLKGLLLVDPNDVEVIFRLAGITAMRGDLPEAVELLDAIPDDHPEAGIPALGQSADWCLQLERYDDSQRRYRRVLELLAHAPEAHRKLAYLFNRQGRRHEAAAHLYQLCRQGNVRQDELHALVHLSDAMYDDPSQAAASPGENRYFPIGRSGVARKLFMEENYRDAVLRLHESVANGDEPASIVAFYGRAAAEAQDDERFHWWLTKTDEATKEFAEYWAAIGTYLVLHRRPEEGLRALLEAVDRDPTDFRSIGRIRSALETLGRTEEAPRWEDRWKQLRDISGLNNRIADAGGPNVEAMEKLADMLDGLDRTLEGILWRSMAAMHRKLPRESLLELNTQLGQLVNADRGFPDQAKRLCNIDPNEFPLPEIELPPDQAVSVAQASRGDATKPQPARFVNLADEIGLQHAYQVASERLDFGFSVYQSVGGAVAVIDYDQDGHADLYFAQGGADPPDFVGSQSNVLYRNLGGQLKDATEFAAAKEHRYSMGVTVGDWNQDGFADIVVANVGANALLLNNGDGTFSKTRLDDRDDKTMMTTSLAMGDLTGDGLPDLFELNYLHDSDIAQRPAKNARGEVIKTLMPADFDPGHDRIFVNDQYGQASFQEISESESAPRAGLGVVVGDFDHQRGNEIFVGNDVYANQFWKRSGDEERWTDLAMLNGCAFGFNGVKTASMGVAAGDFDRNGSLDLHITNFHGESVSFYLNEGGLFQDRNVQFGLVRDSVSVLGFGTQAIDYDNDGKLDLVVANGHIENALSIAGPFQQPAQLFCNLGDRFELVGVADESGYWQRRHLGRGLARLDFNRDGKMDFAVTHLGERSALLENRTSTTNHWLQLCLIGVESERDSIGAKVQIRFGGHQLTEWVVAGDGFLCRNEAVVSFGLGGFDVVDQVTIDWPSGRTQTLAGLKANQRVLVVENEDQAFSLLLP